jgi:toxin FitB
MFLLDTNVISELRRPDKANPDVIKWADSIPAVQFFISVISLLEIERGALLVARRNEAQGKILRAWVDDHVLGRFESRILAIDNTVALRCARLHITDPRSERDALIAATAHVHRMTVVTRNVGDFAETGVNMHNPWKVYG